MGFFDRFSEKKRPVPTSGPAEPVTGVMARLVAARERLEANDVPGALAIYEEVLATSGDRADVLVTISGDLGVNGRIAEIIELISPRYDAERHGPATGINLLQAYMAARNVEAAQHVLDLLFGLKRADLNDRLFGFSNAIAELMQTQKTLAAQEQQQPEAGPAEQAKVSLVSISKPIWFYGLEALADQVLPPKSERLRRVAFAQLALVGLPESTELAKRPEDELSRLTRALPLWLAETFYFSPHYAPIAAVGIIDQHYAVFPSEWSTDNLRQLVDTNKGELDYIFTGALRHKAGDYELVLRVWEVKKFRERKMFTARWNPATADTELARLHEQVRVFMEWSAETRGLAYAPPAAPSTWLATLGTALSLFLAEKNLLPSTQLALVEETLARAAGAASTTEAASLAFLTLRNRAERLQLSAALPGTLASSPLIAQARQTLGA